MLHRAALAVAPSFSSVDLAAGWSLPPPSRRVGSRPSSFGVDLEHDLRGFRSTAAMEPYIGVVSLWRPSSLSSTADLASHGVDPTRGLQIRGAATTTYGWARWPYGWAQQAYAWDSCFFCFFIFINRGKKSTHLHGLRINQGLPTSTKINFSNASYFHQRPST